MAAWSEPVRLRHLGAAAQAQPGAHTVRLREPCGRDELALDGVDTGAAVGWLRALLAPPGAPPGIDPAGLSASDRDALLAAAHRALWGDRIVSTFACAACGAMVDLSFELSLLQKRLHSQAQGAVAGPLARQLRAPAMDEDAAWRLPDAAAEQAAANWDHEAGHAAARAQLAAQVAAPGQACDPIELARQLDRWAPLLDVDLDARCSECGHAQTLRFDLQSFTLQRLLDEREAVILEVHTLASGYGWSLAEIGALPRSLRRALAERLHTRAAGAAAFG